MNILYICTHNRCRSILSEAITNQLAQGKYRAFSAGSQPVGEVHPLSIKYLAEKGIATDKLKSQSWDDFEDIKPDIVVTVCDSAAAEVCPHWFDDTLKVHWGLTDPSKLDGTESEFKHAFYQVMESIERRVHKLMSLDFSTLSKPEQLKALQSVV
ncbi:arsenate reductase ArsC [Psychrosphaera sp. B3R10]|uniref:Arsenate reductase ArsC n=1 Tax=Psychrosphaera algicola TaxID=3023714 RepID=A0ABT5FAI7_9GAMM|nr:MULTISPECIES: arsenate reductase ArsC [unclassified Psychrosphaera]MBU2883575.1 arsenate reductase ArsC [Psychrosphaera sp. I2R16]MBU2989753.1 arsenate reductase ArsC [Psychrosphaera sp. B3R10]MDC2888550.1 arsenate reductase ArsC [Psychrosphaera sp. G1-22]